MDPIDYDVLNAVCLKKMATSEAVAEATGHPVADVEAAAARLAEAGELADVGGTFLPTDSAAGVLDEEAAQRYSQVRSDWDVLDAAERFDSLNSGFLTAMSSWQLVKLGDKQVTNDHSDPDYDDKVVRKIERLVDRLEPILTTFAGHDARFGAYPGRFHAALDQVARGKVDFVSSPAVDSVHNVWFEFHEDLLRTLGRERKA